MRELKTDYRNFLKMKQDFSGAFWKGIVRRSVFNMAPVCHLLWVCKQSKWDVHSAKIQQWLEKCCKTGLVSKPVEDGIGAISKKQKKQANSNNHWNDPIAEAHQQQSVAWHAPLQAPRQLGEQIGEKRQKKPCEQRDVQVHFSEVKEAERCIRWHHDWRQVATVVHVWT